MKRQFLMNFCPALCLAVSVALTPLIGMAESAPPNGPPMAPPPAMARDSGAPPDANSKFSPPASEVVKLVKSGMAEDVVKAYVAGTTSTFNLTTDDLVSLQGMGVPSSLMAAMLNHDNGLRDKAQQYASTMQPSTEPPTAPYPNYPPQPADSGYGTTAPDNYYPQPAGNGAWNYDDNYGSYWLPNSSYVYTYPWGVYDWCFFPGRGWGWYGRGGLGFGGRNGFGGNRFGGGFGRGGVGGIGGRSFGGVGSSFGGGMGRSFASRAGGFSGGRAGGFSGGHAGGFSGGHAGGFSGGHAGGFSGGGGGGGGGHR